MQTAMVRIEGLEKWFGTRHVIKGISLTIEQGDIYGFIGKNGAGKTTVMRMLCGLMRPTKGLVETAGLRVPSGRQSSTGTAIGFLPQNIRFDDNQSGREIIDFFCKLKGECNTGALRFAHEMDLDVAQKARDMSPGQQRKLQLAVATIGKPGLLVLDEPTAGLDPTGVQQVRQAIRSLNEYGCTIFISSHVLLELDNLCTKVAVIDDGRLLYQGVCSGMYEIEVEGEGTRVDRLLEARYKGRCSWVDGRVHARVERQEVPALLGYLHECGVPVFSAKPLGLEQFYNSLVKEGA